MKRLSVLLIVGVLVALSAMPALAIADPDSLLWTSAVGYTDTVEDGDYLIIGFYNIEYATIPLESASETFLASASFESAIVQSDNPTPYNDNGYGVGIVSFYWSADQATDLSFTTTGLWEVTIQGSPSAFPSPLTVTTSSIPFSTGVASNLALTLGIRTLASGMEALWNADGDQYDLLEGSLLASDGEDYFEQVIPNLRQMAPKLFGGSISAASFQEFEETFTQDERQVRQTVLSGTTLDANFLAIEAEWQVPWMISAAIFFYSVVAVFCILYMRTPRAKVEFVFVVFLIATPFGAYAGLVDMVFAALVAFAATLAIVYFVSWRGAN